MWKSSLYYLTSSIATKQSITTVLKIIGTNESIYVTNIYAPHRAVERIKMLQSISKLVDSIQLPFKIVAGEINIVINLEGKKGGMRKLDKDSKAFQSTINGLSLIDIPTNNDTFTLNNKRGEEIQIDPRLDRFLLSEEIFLTSWETEARILPQSRSDHWPISLKLHISLGLKNRPCRFKSFWLEHPNFMGKMK